MSSRGRVLRRVGAAIAVAFWLGGGAHAVTAIGAPKRVDEDTGSSAAHAFGNFYAIRTATGGFAVAWEENTEPETPIVYEGVRFRVYGDAFAPVAAPQSANLSGDKRVPTLARIVPLGSDRAYLIYALTRDNDNPDHPEVREAFGQTIALASGAATGPRRLLNSAGIWDSLIAIAAGLPDGRAVVAWYESDAYAPATGRFISSAGVPQAINLDFACCVDEAQLTGLFALGSRFVASYLRNSIFGGANGLHGRLFKANGDPSGAPEHVTTSTLNPFIRTLSNGRIALFTFVPVGNPVDHYRLMAQLYDRDWVKIGAAKTLIADVTTTKYLDFAPTLDGGVLMIRTLLNGSVYRRSVRRLDGAFAAVGPDYTFASQGFDFLRAAALSPDRAVVVFRNTSNGRQRLLAQIVSY